MNKQKIKDFAKDLYLELDITGERKYSLREIAQKVEQKFNKHISFNSVRNWAEKDNWEKLLTEIKGLSVQKAKNEQFTKDEQIKEAKSNENAEIFKAWKYVFGTQLKEYQERVKGGRLSDIRSEELLSGMKKAFDCMAGFLDIKPVGEEQKVIEVKIV